MAKERHGRGHVGGGPRPDHAGTAPEEAAAVGVQGDPGVLGADVLAVVVIIVISISATIEHTRTVIIFALL